MKELTIEQKAKAYDETIKRANELLYVSDKESLQYKTIKHILPELKESEDEKIRKRIIATIHLYYGEPLEDEAKEMIDWLEKQGWQKHKIQPKFKIGDIIRFKGNETLKGEAETHKIVSYDNESYVFDDGTTDLFCEQDLYELVEQKSTDKVEPKFHEGDWILNNVCFPIQIASIEGDMYVFTDGEAISSSFVDENYHLWSIQDAEEGDVLCSESEWTCIFRALDNHTNTFSSYCFMDSDKWFCNTGCTCHTLDEQFIRAYNFKLHPATKEQRDTLMKAMADAGYIFDFEKKELKKIEQKPAEWSEEDEQYLLVCKNALRKYQASDKWDAAIISHWLENKLKAPQSTWKPSDEQMKILNEVLNFAANHENPHWNDYIFGTLNNLIRQLKKLREE